MAGGALLLAAPSDHQGVFDRHLRNRSCASSHRSNGLPRSLVGAYPDSLTSPARDANTVQALEGARVAGGSGENAQAVGASATPGPSPIVREADRRSRSW